MAKLVRLRPLDMKKGHVIRRFTAFSTQFEERKGWYRVSDEVAAYLATVHQLPHDEDSPLAFDVCTEADARKIDAAEKKKAEQRARASEPNAAGAREVLAPEEVVMTEELRSRRRRTATVPAGRG